MPKKKKKIIGTNKDYSVKRSFVSNRTLNLGFYMILLFFSKFFYY